MTADGLPSEGPYGEGVDVPADTGSLIYEELERGWDDVDWTAPVDPQEDSLEMVVDAATQFHYIYLSQLILLGGLIRGADDTDAKRLATMLAVSRMRDVDAWGRYLGKVEATATVSSALKEYFQELFADHRTASMFIGVGLADVFRYALAENLQNTGDDLFEQLIERDVTQGTQNMEMSEEYLSAHVGDLSQEGRDAVRKSAYRYRDLIEAVVRSHIASLDTISRDPEDIIAAAEDAADDYFDRIGLNRD